jgi:transposase
LSADGPSVGRQPNEGTLIMIVIGVDPHKRSHTAAAVDANTGELGAKTVPARDHGHGELVRWARGLGDELTFAVEDCRHVSGGLERFLLAHAESVVRVAPKLMAGARLAERERGKSDAIDAQAIARAALRVGPESLPCARLDEQTLEIKLLLDHREDLVGERTRMQNRLRWHLHDLIPELEIPAGALDRLCWLERIGRRLARLSQQVRVRVARELVRRVRELTRECSRLEAELGRLVRSRAPQLLALQGCGALTAAKILVETAGVRTLP